jgi:signal peptidase I
MNSQDDTYTILKEISFELLAEGKAIRARAEGFSMYPFIRPGSIILLGPVSDDTVLSPGEIIAWKRDSGFVLHRLVSIIRKDSETLYITRGDSCLDPDPPVKKEQISGKVLAVEDRHGKSREGEKLISKPCYFCNRLRIWCLFRMKRLMSIFGRPFTSNEKQG